MTDTANVNTVEETMAMLAEMGRQNPTTAADFAAAHADADLDPEHPEWDDLKGHWVSVKLGEPPNLRFFHGELSNINAGCLVLIGKGNVVHPIVRAEVVAVTAMPKP